MTGKIFSHCFEDITCVLISTGQSVNVECARLGGFKCTVEFCIYVIFLHIYVPEITDCHQQISRCTGYVCSNM